MRLALITPFLDRRHGTERCVIEQLEKFPAEPGTEIHIYANSVEDLRGVVRYKAGVTPSSDRQLYWHKVPALPGPHLFRYIFWFYANRLCRAWDAKVHHLKYDLVYSPGINAADADAISVHILFHELNRQAVANSSFRRTPLSGWPRMLHRRLYYRLIMGLEKKIYSQPRAWLAPISALLASKCQKHFSCANTRVIRYGVDTEYFSPARRLAARSSAREKFNLLPEDFTILFIGNDWKNKGLDALLRALAEIRDRQWKLLVVGLDARESYDQFIREHGLPGRVEFVRPSPHVLEFYAAADAYVGPSMEDAYALPVIEAMACGLPIICSSRAGVSEIIRQGMNGLVLCDPQDAREIEASVRMLMSDAALRQEMGKQASATALRETWMRNAEATWEWLSEVLKSKQLSRR